MTEDEIRAKIFSIVAKSFSVGEADLSDDTRADDVDGWDSLAHATLLIRITKAFDIDLNMDAANRVQDLGSLIRMVREAQR